jgi:hypothetical protein
MSIHGVFTVALSSDDQSQIDVIATVSIMQIAIPAYVATVGSAQQTM